MKMTKTIKTAALVGSALVLGMAASAHAQSAAPAPAAADDSLTFHGITLSGTVDIGLQYDNHGAPISDYHPAGTNPFVAKQNSQSITGVIPSGLSQSKVTLAGKEAFNDEFSGVFKLETFFNPQSGNLSDALKSLTLNNGVALASQTMSADSSIAGQLFNSAAYAGISSKHYGTITFGRQTSLLADGVGAYDPMAASQAFSVVGFSGTYAGGGDTQDRRFDDSVKYLIQVDHFRAGALYKFKQNSGEANSAYSFQLGASAADASIDFFYEKVHAAVGAASLSAAQVAGLVTSCPGCAVDKTVAATISDNETFAVMGSYKYKIVKLTGAYEHIKYENPTTPLVGATGTAYNDIGGYTVPYALLNQTAYTTPKQLDVIWAGAQVSVTKKLSVWLAYYNIHQNSYATGANAGCSTSLAGSCSGDLQAFSAVGIYDLNKHVALYAGIMASNVTNGFASGYLFTNEIDPTAGVRLRF
jgi:predicted porin